MIRLLILFSAMVIAGEVMAAVDRGCYRQNPRCTFGPPTGVAGPGNYRCPRGERPWIAREDPLPRCRFDRPGRPDSRCYRRNPQCTARRPGDYRCPTGERLWIAREDAAPHCRFDRPGIPDRRPNHRRPNRSFFLERAERVLTEPVTIAVETYIGGERVRVTVDGQALVSPTAGERFRRSAQRRFSSLRDLRNYVQRVHCRSARDEQFPRRGPARLIYGNSNSILLDNVKVSPDAKLAVYTSYSVGAFFDKRAINRQLIVCDSP